MYSSFSWDAVVRLPQRPAFDGHSWLKLSLLSGQKTWLAFPHAETREQVSCKIVSFWNPQLTMSSAMQAVQLVSHLFCAACIDNLPSLSSGVSLRHCDEAARLFVHRNSQETFFGCEMPEV